MILKSDIDITQIASGLADCGDLDQAQFFEVFFSALRLNCENEYRFLAQKTAIADRLPDEVRESLSFMGSED